MRRQRVRAGSQVAVATLALAAALLSPAGAAASPRLGSVGPCGLLPYDSTAPPVYQHVVVIMDENLSYQNFLASTQAPYLQGLAAACGSEADMHAATHPSQGNYMAATSGVVSGSAVQTAADNVFHQLQVAGRSWRNYAESMPSSCAHQTLTVPLYKNGHTPAFWYTDLVTPRNTCAKFDVPLSPALDTAITTDRLPTYSWITPNVCDDMHWAATCTYPSTSRVAVGDTWLSTLVPRLTAMPSYQAGRTLVVVTFDEGDGDNPATSTGVDCADPTYYPLHPDCQIPTVVVSPYVVPGAVDTSDNNLYTLLATTEDIFGLPRLGRAVGSLGMRAGLAF